VLVHIWTAEVRSFEVGELVQPSPDEARGFAVPTYKVTFTWPVSDAMESVRSNLLSRLFDEVPASSSWLTSLPVLADQAASEYFAASRRNPVQLVEQQATRDWKPAYEVHPRQLDREFGVEVRHQPTGHNFNSAVRYVSAHLLDGLPTGTERDAALAAVGRGIEYHRFCGYKLAAVAANAALSDIPIGFIPARHDPAAYTGVAGCQSWGLRSPTATRFMIVTVITGMRESAMQSSERSFQAAWKVPTPRGTEG